MANTWLRLWHDMPNDPKWRTIARLSGKDIALVQAVFLQLLVSASENSERGCYDVSVEDIASALNEDDSNIEAVLKHMEGRVLSGNHLTGWANRQLFNDDPGEENKKLKSYYVYFVVLRSNYDCYVGISSNPWARVNDLKKGLNEKIEVFAKFRSTTESIENIKKFLESSLKANGWYEATDAIYMLINKVKNKTITNLEEAENFLSLLPEANFRLLRNHYVDIRSYMRSYFVATYTDTDTDTDLKEKNKKHTCGSDKKPVDKKPPKAKTIKTKNYPEDFETLWQAYPRRLGADGKAMAYKAWQVRISEGILPQTMLEAVQRYAAYCDAERLTGTKFVQMPQRFLGPYHEFDNPWTPSQDSVNSGNSGGKHGQNPEALRTVQEQRRQCGLEQRQEGPAAGVGLLGTDGGAVRGSLDPEEWIEAVIALDQSAGEHDR
ncbi:hypothetical protein [Pantoea sp. BAV 3049]|uniref:hypothetical protein n=1 Tax=Pantoea sp. BAV 3049 TaxID=2654188 RepID=UPI00131D0128|nr:hypothetical protein [Pantoea sp. BAV 3049]